MWCFTCCFRRPPGSFQPQDGSNPIFTVEMTESMKRQSVIDGNLNELIERWIFSLKDYRHLEEDYILSGIVDIDAVLKLRNDPESLLSSSNNNIRELAIKRCNIFLMMTKLKIAIPRSQGKDERTGKNLPVDPIFNSFNHVDNEMVQTANHSVTSQANSNDNISSLVSSRWASRLGNMYNRDVDTKVENDNESHVINTVGTRELKLKWPDFLPDVSYDVLKISLFEHSIRTLKLTEYHILDIKESNKICDIFLLTEIKRIWLRNADTLVLTLKSNKEIHYSSPIASHVIQQITSRVKIRIALEKGFSFNSVSNNNNTFQGIEYSAASTAKIISEISQTNHTDCDNTIKVFANDLSVKTKQLRKKSIIALPNRNAEELKRTDVTTSQTTKNKIKTFTLQAFAVNSSEYKVQRKLQDILCDPSSPEGRTKDDFVANFTYRNRQLKDLRNFIESMNDHIIIHRGNCLAFILRNNCDEESGVNLIESLNESELAILSYIIYTTIEESMFLPLKDKIVSLCREFNDDSVAVSKISALSNRNQVDWGIEEKYVSPLGWQNAIFELSNLEINLSPSTQMNAITRAAKAIYSEFKLAIIPRLKAQGQNVPEYLGADDFVPIFIYVVSKSSLKHPTLNKDIMWNLCHPELLRGEIGYFLTVYESAVEFITSEPTDNESDVTRFSEIANKSRSSITSESSSISNISVTTLRRISQFIVPMTRSLGNQTTDISLRESFNHL